MATADDQQETREARLANQFDIRRLIGAVFLLYGLVLTALGIFGSSHVKNKAAGLNIDLWAGLGMLVFAALMIAWALLRPVEPEPPETRGRGSGRIRRSPAT
jgi:NADH:ubiquinone oxidoreductase subunit 6 (subunit J)